MNCKPGDLAVIISSDGGHNLGKIVRVLQLHWSSEYDLDGARFNKSDGPRWILEKPIDNIEGDPLFTFPDAALRPIRDSDGEDESLTWAGKPEAMPA